MADMEGNVNSVSRSIEKEAVLFRRALTAGFVLLLPVAVIARCLPRQWRPSMLHSGEHLSIVDEARAAANTFVPFVFMD